jgi:glyoxylase-like metal-dependent hydrolase (beta-lactamase superfamily II)
MAQMRDEGKINDHTYLVDAVHEGVSGGFAVYLLKGKDGGTCLIDAGTRDSAKVIYEKLKTLDAWPPDRIILTHSHWDHTQGTEYLRGKAREGGNILQVFASEKAIPYLADQSYNVCFGTDQAPYVNIGGVFGLKNGDKIDLGNNITITVVDTPGHMVDHISIWDESTGNILVGDAIGMKWTDGFIVSNPNSPFWNEADYLKSIATLKALDVKTISLGHFGCLTGDDAKNFLDDSVETYRKWMAVFTQKRQRIDDIPYIVEIIWSEVYPHMPDKFKALVLPALTDAVELAAHAYAKRHPLL